MALGACALEGCDDPRYRREWCSRHYQRWQRHGDPSVFVPLNWAWDTLIEKLEKLCHRDEKSCLLWPFGKDRSGYGKFRISGLDLRVSRAVLMKITGTTGQVAMHSCDNPTCVNIDHLRWGTWSENAQDMWEKGRAAMNLPHHRGERNGRSKLTDAQRLEIRNRRREGEKQIDLAREFSVTRDTIRRTCSFTD